MTKVHPKRTATTRREEEEEERAAAKESAVLTVWKKSLLLSCSGFTVFNGGGDIVFRVDNYVAPRHKGEILLMDASGTPLLTIRRKKLSIGETWLIYEGETAVNPRFTVRKDFLNSGTLAHMTSHCLRNNNSSSSSSNAASYDIKGSYRRRCCTVYDARRRVVMEIKRKEAAALGDGVGFGTDVFCLVVHPGIDAALAMALVILLDQMFPSPSTRFSP